MDAFDLALAEQSEQGSQNWIDVRAGRFTSSEMHRLMGSGKRPMTDAELKARPKTGKGSKAMFIEDPSVVSDDAMTYITEKVAETLTGMPKMSVYSHATAHGEEMEPVAAEEYAKRYGVVLEPVGFVPMGNHAGGTADRKIQGTNIGVEIKCPFNPKVMVDYLMLTDFYDLKRMFPEYYWQCQSNILFAAFDAMKFVAYDFRMKEPKHQMKVIDIPRVEDDIDLIGRKLEYAVKEKLDLLKLLQ